ncbi:uncharacterized protein PV09_03048 [Verruconis gallopava]|uniref:Uncharacterized protein n=1 Tax=Verruconis gallopava TaxID=253628 RepID=A0A0D2B3J9_9PEZI|nr:uncharacterized protein PV09_03048 [Verruconis gallopava]KIW05844.1 hypothetical protein PV09_03048 [Verruconis gallopava]
MRLADLSQHQKPQRRPPSPILQLPRISTFRTEHEHRALSCKAHGFNKVLPNPSNDDVTTAVARCDLSTSLEKEWPRFLQPRSKRSTKSQPTTPEINSATADNLLSGNIASIKEHQARSPGKIHTGLLWHLYKSHDNDTKAPVLAKSRRTGTFDQITSQQNEVAVSAESMSKFRTPRLHPERPPLPKYPSSEVSPCDISFQGLNRNPLEPLEKTSTHVETSKGVKLRSSPRKHGLGRKTIEYFGMDSEHVSSSPIIGPSKGKRITSYFLNNFILGGEVESQTAYVDQGQTSSVGETEPLTVKESVPTTSEADQDQTEENYWFRVRVDNLLDDEQVEDVAKLTAMFDWDVPDHLPSSPLCPANPKHKGGGKGICVYHGRAKAKITS